jgi:hypothetical protein
VVIGKKGGLVFACNAPAHKCPNDEILRILGLSYHDLYPRELQKGNAMATATTAPKKTDNKIATSAPPAGTAPVPPMVIHEYRDEKGVLLMEVLRHQPKRFSQRRPNPAYDPKQKPGKDNPQYLYNLDGVRRVIYRLPDLLRAIKEKPARRILIVEGEKDVDLCYSKGIAATCNPMGALKWAAEYVPFFKGLNVGVIPDEDPIDPTKGVSAGLLHAEEICKSLIGVATSIKLIRLPGVGDKGDISDWWAKEKGTDDEKRARLGELIKTTGEWVPPQPAPVPESTEEDIGPTVDADDSDGEKEDEGTEEGESAGGDQSLPIDEKRATPLNLGRGPILEMIAELLRAMPKLRSVAEAHGMLRLHYVAAEGQVERTSAETLQKSVNMANNEKMKIELIKLAATAILFCETI